jgi:hypothetical protein
MVPKLRARRTGHETNQRYRHRHPVLASGTTALAHGQRDEQQGKQKQEQQGGKKDDKFVKTGRSGGRDGQEAGRAGQAGQAGHGLTGAGSEAQQQQQRADNTNAVCRKSVRSSWSTSSSSA